MKDKYYTPDIEDLYVGMELHYINDHTKKISSENLSKLIITPKQLSFILNPLYYKNEDNFNPNLMSYVIPYLTKEQIEAEGLPFQKTNGLTNWFFINTWDLPDEKIQDFYRYKAYSVTILQMPDNQLKIYFDFSGGNPEDSCMFEGECKSINEFRKIMKMLKIK